MASIETASVNPVTPRVEDRLVCIATAAGLPLAAMISSYFDEPGTYFALFEFPTLQFPYTGVTDQTSDGYYASVLGDKAAAEINNALARIQPEQIVLVGLTDAEQSYLRARLPEERLVVVPDIEGFLAQFGDTVNHTSILNCRPIAHRPGRSKWKWERYGQSCASNAYGPIYSRM